MSLGRHHHLSGSLSTLTGLLFLKLEKQQHQAYFVIRMAVGYRRMR
ncbi:hypothetical protein LINGRAHAP2_LOCUS23077 [Linum grandiflorum]